MSSGLDGRVVVRTARCRTRRRDRASLRDALERLDPETGLPRSAILVVHRLSGTLLGNPPRLDGVQLRAVAASAHRAGSTPPPPDCDAVLFADEAEVLTSLCRDVSADRPLGWWWTTLLGRAVPGAQAHEAAVTAAFDRYARALPAATARAPQKVAVAASALPGPEILRVTGAMAKAHGADQLADVLRGGWHQAIRPSPTSATWSSVGGREGGGASPAGVGASGAAAPFAGRTGITGGAGTPPLVALLVDLALLLHRDPLGARSSATAQNVAARLATVDLTGRGAVRPRVPRVRPGPGPADPTAPPDVFPPATESGDMGSSDTGHGAPASVDAASGRDADVHDGSAPEPGDQDDPGPEGIDTALGGAFYLLNLLELLDLPDSADGEGEPGGLLTRWGVLALVLRAWPDVDPEDAVFGVLDELAWPDAEHPLDRDQPWVFRTPPAAGALVERFWQRSTHDGEPGAARTDVDGPERWARRVAEVLVALLASRGLDPGVVRVPARVTHSGFSVRVHMSLDDVDLDARRAGLDRDPGWVPALGRVVELVFS